MEALTQIVHLLDGFKLSKIDIIDSQDSTSRFTEFYRLIKNGDLKSDEEAARYFYPDLDKRDQNYRKFKSQFKERLINTVLFLDTHNKKASEYQNALAEAQKIWAVTCILYNRFAIASAIEISEKLLKHCIYYEFTELIIQITDKLKNMNGTVMGDRSKFDHYQAMHFKYVNYFMAELKVKDLFQMIRLDYVKSSAYIKGKEGEVDKAIAIITPLKETCDTYMFMQFWYLIHLAKYQTIFDNKNIVRICDEGITYFKGKDYAATAPIAIFMNQKLIGQIQLRQYEAGKVTAAEVLTLQVEGTHNWYKTLEQHMMLAFHTQEYTEAYKVYQIALNHRDFKFLKGGNLEIWLLFEAYLCFVLKMGRIAGLTIEKSIFKNFKVNRFLNNISQFSTDKKGMNIPTLIIQFVLQMTEKKHGQLVDRIEAMEQYVKRHVKSDETVYRSHCFLKLLLDLSKVNYSKKQIAARAKSLLIEISNSQLNIMEQGDRIEIMPFEDLWEEMQTLLNP
jgi:uncharacterized membrane protein